MPPDSRQHEGSYGRVVFRKLSFGHVADVRDYAIRMCDVDSLQNEAATQSASGGEIGSRVYQRSFFHLNILWLFVLPQALKGGMTNVAISGPLGKGDFAE